MIVEHGKILLAIARAAIARALDVPSQADESAPWLQQAGACFVTLTQHGELRGCIGTLVAYQSLLDDVKKNARAAALHDPRFPPLSARELGITVIEISLLSQPQPMEFVDEQDALAQLRPGVDGVVFEFGPHRSTFLPQVWQQLAQPKKFMAHLKRKAGLPEDFWAETVQLSRYSVSHCREDER